MPVGRTGATGDGRNTNSAVTPTQTGGRLTPPARLRLQGGRGGRGELAPAPRRVLRRYFTVSVPAPTLTCRLPPGRWPSPHLYEPPELAHERNGGALARGGPAAVKTMTMLPCLSSRWIATAARGESLSVTR